MTTKTRTPTKIPLATKTQTPKKKNFVISLGVYPFDIMISLGETDDEFRAALDRKVVKYSDEFVKMPAQSKGVFYMNPEAQSFIRMAMFPDSPEDLGALAHEVFHAVTYIMDRVGQKLKLRRSDESYAYLIQYITTELFKEIL